MAVGGESWRNRHPRNSGGLRRIAGAPRQRPLATVALVATILAAGMPSNPGWARERDITAAS